MWSSRNTFLLDNFVLTAVLGLQGPDLKDGVNVELGGAHGCQVHLHAATDDLTPGHKENEPQLGASNTTQNTSSISANSKLVRQQHHNTA